MESGFKGDGFGRRERPPLPKGLRENAPLAPLTTLELGGPARFLAEPDSTEGLVEVLRWAESGGVPVEIIGGGSNVVVSDDGFEGLVVRAAQRGTHIQRDGEIARLTAVAGEPWDEVVALAVGEGLAGLECLSGIPGTVGATPVQNVGAYGQEVGQTLDSVLVLDRHDLTQDVLTATECGLGYRTSVFRREPGRWVILCVTFALKPGGAPALAYPELESALRTRSATPTLGDVRQIVLELRRGKSMVLDPANPNRRSAGSFFLNPIVSREEADRVIERVIAAGAAGDPAQVPAFPTEGGKVKLSAAFLVEQAGFPRGLSRGPVGLSSAHALALIHHGGGSTTDLVRLASDIRAAVHEVFGVQLQPEPTFIGWGSEDPLGELISFQ